MRRQSSSSLTASPLLVGAVTLLVGFVAVFLAYNANSGLPFVPTYNLSAELPTGSKLVKGNDVRVGGFRVGFVERLRPGTSDAGKAVAIVDMKLDKQVEPLARDTTARVRPRSPLGIKFIELTPGVVGRHATPPGTRSASPQPPRRSSSRTSTTPSRRRPARACAERPRVSATPWPGAASR